MALAFFLSGAYAGAYNAVAIGPTDGGYEISHEVKQENIDKSDVFGDTLLDYVWRGGNVTCDFTAKTVGSAAGNYSNVAILWPFGGTQATLMAAATPIGRLASDIASAFVLTSTANTPAAATPATLTCTKAIIAPGYNTKMLYTSQLRQLPLRLQFLPTLNAGIVSFYTTT